MPCHVIRIPRYASACKSTKSWLHRCGNLRQMITSHTATAYRVCLSVADADTELRSEQRWENSTTCGAFHCRKLVLSTVPGWSTCREAGQSNEIDEEASALVWRAAVRRQDMTD